MGIKAFSDIFRSVNLEYGNLKSRGNKKIKKKNGSWFMLLGVITTTNTLTSLTLGFNRSGLYYQPKKGPHVKKSSAPRLRRYRCVISKYGYRRIRVLLLRMGYTVENVLGRTVSAERLIRTLKAQEIYLNDYDNIPDARERVRHFLEQVYNQKRPHISARLFNTGRSGLNKKNLA